MKYQSLAIALLMAATTAHAQTAEVQATTPPVAAPSNTTAAPSNTTAAQSSVSPAPAAFTPKVYAFSVKGDAVLRLITRADTNKVTALKTLGFVAGLFGGGLSSRSITFKKEDLKGTHIDAIRSPGMEALPELLKSELTTYFAAHPGADSSRAEMTVEVGDWMLVYQELGKSDTPYELRWNSKVRGNGTVDCNPPVELKPIEEWQANDYAEVKAAGARHAKACAAEVASKLASWYPEVVASVAPAAPAETSATPATPTPASPAQPASTNTMPTGGSQAKNDGVR